MQREVLSEETAFIMTSMLEGVVNGGTGAHVRDFFQLPAAGKTGTTIGVRRCLVRRLHAADQSQSVWVGFDNKSVHFKTWDGQGGRAAAPIWGRFMKYVYDDPNIAMPLEYFEKPAGVLAETICVGDEEAGHAVLPGDDDGVFHREDETGPLPEAQHVTWHEGEEGLGTMSF